MIYVLLAYLIPLILCLLVGRYLPSIDDSNRIFLNVALIPIINIIMLLAYAVVLPIAIIYRMINDEDKLIKFKKWYFNKKG